MFYPETQLPQIGIKTKKRPHSGLKYKVGQKNGQALSKIRVNWSPAFLLLCPSSAYILIFGFICSFSIGSFVESKLHTELLCKISCFDGKTSQHCRLYICVC